MRLPSLGPVPTAALLALWLAGAPASASTLPEPVVEQGAELAPATVTIALSEP